MCREEVSAALRVGIHSTTANLNHEGYFREEERKVDRRDWAAGIGSPLQTRKRLVTFKRGSAGVTGTRRAVKQAGDQDT
jgi:hypothetical protein